MNAPAAPRRRALLGAAAAATLAGCARPAVPPAAGGAAPGSLRIAVASCCDQTKPQPVWDAVLAEAPEHMVFAGDNVYASQQPFDIAALRAAYALQARVDNFRRLRERIPHSAIWDDHDYGLNDGGAEFPHRQARRTPSSTSGPCPRPTSAARARACTTRCGCREVVAACS